MSKGVSIGSKIKEKINTKFLSQCFHVLENIVFFMQNIGKQQLFPATVPRFHDVRGVVISFFSAHQLASGEFANQ